MQPRELDLPDKFTEFRLNQLQLAAKVATSGKYAFMLDAPTGVGKSLIAAAAQKISDKKMVYCATTKQLQEQLVHDFPYAKTLKGRANYPCARYPRMFPDISADDCTHSDTMPCPLVGSCRYNIAKREALQAPLAVLNTAYFMTEANYVGGFTDLDFLTLDECDTLESQLMGFISLVITQDQLTRYKLPLPKFKTKFESWIPWSKNAADLVSKILKDLAPKLEGEWGGVDFKAMKDTKRLTRLLAKLRYFYKEVDDTWVWYPSDTQWEFKPTWVSKYADNSVWHHAKKVLMMSATILDPRQVMLNVGLNAKDGHDYEYVQMDSPFPKENRPIYYEPCANVVAREMDVALPRLAKAVSKIMDEYPHDRMLIHTVSYKIRDYILHNVKSNRRFVTHTIHDRAEVLEKFKNSGEPLVLLSPSMDRGVDLPDNECRVVVIAKMPYLDLGDPQVSKRVYGSKDGNSWYAHKAVSSVVQMSGRAVRSATDHADTFILDEQFEKLYREYKYMFPRWWKEALVM